MLTASSVAHHNTRKSCWVIINSQVYDLTEFLDHHPGGSSVILQYAGKDATKAFDPVHPAGTIERYLTRDTHKGPVRSSASDQLKKHTRTYQLGDKIPLNLCMRIDDFERAAKLVMSEAAFVYYKSAAEDHHALGRNRDDWSKVLLRPRVLVDVSRVNIERCIMEYKSSLPFFVAPAAMARLGHPDGELCLVRAAADFNIPYCVSTYSSVAHEELSDCWRELQRQEHKNGILFFQLYVNKRKDRTRELIKLAKARGFKALLITVDTAVGGKREEDEFLQAKLAYEAGEDAVIRPTYSVSSEERPIVRGAHSSTLNWEDIKWISEDWGNAGPIYLKGIQSAEDAKRALNASISGIYLSNHGGRQLDSGPSSLFVLLEIRKFHPEVLQQLEVYLDGGVRRGSDVVKALCLGATAVGIGRPFMYALGAYGTDGVRAAIQILSDEIEHTLRLIGVTNLSQLNEDFVNATLLEDKLPKRLQAQATSKL